METRSTAFRVKPSMRRVYFYAVLFLAVAVSGYNRLQQFGFGDNVPIVSVGILFVLLLYAHLVRFCTVYIVSDEFAEMRSGILARKGSRAALQRITDFSADQSFLQRILGLATVKINTAGSDSAEITFRNITRYHAKRVIDQLTEHSARLDAQRAQQSTAQVRDAAMNKE